MSGGRPSLRIDWFDGTVIEGNRPNASSSTSNRTDEDPPEPNATSEPKYSEKKPIGFKRLLDLSLLKPPILNLEIAHRPGFWNLLDSKLKGDFIVLIVRILSNIYKSLQPGDKSKIVAMLRTRFEKSNFLEVLKEYLIGLPSVRVVEKRMNSHLWDDAQSFYFEVVALCEGIFSFGDNSTEYLENIYDLLEITETSALGVKEEHTETFNDNLFERIVELKCKIMPFINKVTTIQRKTFTGYLFGLYQLMYTLLQFIYKISIDNTPVQIPECDSEDISFRNLSIFPSKEDLLEENKVRLVPHIINGAYPSVENYLDLQFKLMREDCFGPLREGICQYIENPSKRRHEKIRIYPKVRIIRNYIANNRVGHLVDIAWTDRVDTGLVDRKKYAQNKQLMFGALLLFTSDNFETILCATVLDSNLNLLNEGYLAVSFQNPLAENIFSQAYLMVESEVFFEPYHQVLKVLQSFSVDDLPMRKYIVDVQQETPPPAYLKPETVYTVEENGELKTVINPLLDRDNWPVAYASVIGIDISQLEAYSFALTREFAVIQGPPGTGKTFLGVKIASTLLKNLSLEDTPMLIICYTNHALDQFLEGILNVTTNIVRLGSQSKSEALQPYALHNVRSRSKSKYSYLYAIKKSELENIFKQMTALQTEIEKCEKEILSYKTIKPYLRGCELKNCKGDPILGWLFDHLEDEMENFIQDDDDDNDWEKQYDNYIDDVCGDQFDNLSARDKLETCFSEQWALKEIDSMMNSIRYVKEVTDDHFEGQKMTDKFENQIRKVRKRLNYFKERCALAQNKDVKEAAIDKIKNPYSLPPEKRWDVYYTAVADIKRKLMGEMNILLEQHNTCSAELSEVATVTDCEVIKTVRVVGVTTTMAARRHDLLKRLKSPIVIVEEAAEVLEAHIVASLTHSCEHLILIGDHKQLEPSAAHYKLAKEYNLQISLFERMILNGVHARTLTTQRRMRPCFAELLVPDIYERLDGHPSVYKYEDVRGMKDNLYFYSHDVFEDSEGMEDSYSYKNTLEAKWCVSLANYLRLMKYKSEDITILATYTDQATLIKDLSKKYIMLQDTKITVVDNFQGEESKIVILSLVRSNREGRIGFLTAANRICVALSRAKEGFYIFGNMNVLKSASLLWRSINEKLVAQNAIGNKLIVHCDVHQNTLEVATTEDLDNCYKGPCLRICQNEEYVKTKKNSN